MPCLLLLVPAFLGVLYLTGCTDGSMYVYTMLVSWSVAVIINVVVEQCRKEDA